MRSFGWFLTVIIPLGILLSCGNTPQKEDYGAEEIVRYYPDSVKKVTLSYNKADTAYAIKRIWHHNGQLSIMGKLHHGRRTGEWKAWDEQGRLLTTGHYKEGVDDGRKVVYYRSGQVYYEGLFKDGKRTGRWTFYNPDGTTAKIINYQKVGNGD